MNVSVAGMFTTKLHRSEAKPQSLNRYSYVQNDPVNFVDPSGLDGENPGFIPPSENGWDQLVSRNPWAFHNETAQRVFTYTLYLGETPFTVIDYNPIYEQGPVLQRPRLPQTERAKQQEYDNCVKDKTMVRDQSLEKARKDFENSGLYKGSAGAVAGGIGGGMVAGPPGALLGSILIGTVVGVGDANHEYQKEKGKINTQYQQDLAQCNKMFPIRPEIIRERNRQLIERLEQFNPLLRHPLSIQPRRRR